MKAAPPSRPDPDALLAASGTEGRGRLKIFLGAAPGVGKTFAMLSAAGRLARARIDVVVGVVETHGRRETEALLEGLEILPRRTVDYRGTTVTEFDLDSAITRHPALLVVDELAHTNAPESRHPKRYQDIEELLSVGIDVWTAVNIQHLEGLSDVVSRITGVTVRETVPDTVLERADEVMVVDITPAELITRLQEGRIYLPANASRAAEGFFKPGNLTALRELALRRTAERIDDQMVEHLRRNAIEGAWPTAERLLVCVGSDAAAQRLVRVACRMASGLNATWSAVTLEHVGQEIVDETISQRIDETLSLAARLGATTARLSGRDMVEELLSFARRQNITQIIVGRAAEYGGRRGRGFLDALIDRASDLAVHVVVGDKPSRRRRWTLPRLDARRLWVGVSAAFGAVAAAVGIGMVVTHFLALPNLSMVFLAAVLVCAVTLGTWSAIACALLSFLAYNFFFIQPVYTFTVAEPYELLALFVFLMVAILTGGLAGRSRDQSHAARKRVSTIQALYDVSRKLSGTTGLDDVLWVVTWQAAAAIKGQVVVALPEEPANEPADKRPEHQTDLSVRAAFPPDDALTPGDWAAARWAFARSEPAGWRTDTLPTARYRFLPITTSRGTVGVIGLQPADRSRDISDEDKRAFTALLEQGAIAIERALLMSDARRGEALAERERLQSTLLSSLSHDLRTPLASIIGAASSMRTYGAQMSPEDRKDLLAAIEEEAARLARFVSNLLDMTRVASGALDARRDWIDVADLLAGAVKRARKTFPQREIDLGVADDLPLLRGEAGLLDQVVFNILDNADKYPAAGTTTRVRARTKGAVVEVTVEDEGPGIPAADLERVFDKFTRLKGTDGRAPGTGLGLAIARGAVEAMGGTVRAESPVRGNRGTRIVVSIPVASGLQPDGAHDKEHDLAGAESYPGGR